MFMADPKTIIFPLLYALLGLTITLCDFERKGILVIAVSRPLFLNKFQCIMYRWYVLWVDVQVNLQSSDRLIRITPTESGAVPVMTLLQCHPLLLNKLQRIMYSWYVLWVDVQVNLQSNDRLIMKIQTASGAIPVMTLHYLIWKPLAAADRRV